MSNPKMFAGNLFLSSHYGVFLFVVLAACVVMLILLIRALLHTRAESARADAHADEVMQLNVTVAMMQNRIGVSYRKLSILCGAPSPKDQPHIAQDDEDFRERLAK